MRAEVGVVELGCRIVAEQYLPPFGGALAVDRRRHSWADDEQLSVAGVDEMQVERSAVDTLRDSELDPLDEVGRPSPFDECAHLEAGRSGSGGVVGALEEHEEGVAAELEDVTSVAVDDLDHPAEALVQQLRQFLGAFTSVRGEPLGQRGESGDVGRDQRPLDVAVAGTVEWPTANEIGKVGPDSVRWPFVHPLVLPRHLIVNGVAKIARSWSCSVVSPARSTVPAMKYK